MACKTGFLSFSGRESAAGQDLDWDDPECEMAATKIQDPIQPITAQKVCLFFSK